MTLKHREERSLYQPDHSRTKLVVCDVQMIEHHSFLQWAFNWQSPFQKKPALGFTLNTSQHNAGSVEKANYFNIYQVQITKPINCQKKNNLHSKIYFFIFILLIELKSFTKMLQVSQEYYVENIMLLLQVLCSKMFQIYFFLKQSIPSLSLLTSFFLLLKILICLNMQKNRQPRSCEQTQSSSTKPFLLNHYACN